MLLDSEDEFFITRSTTLEPPSPTMGEEEEVDYSVHSMEWHNGFEVCCLSCVWFVTCVMHTTALILYQAVYDINNSIGYTCIHTCIYTQNKHPTYTRTLYSHTAYTTHTHTQKNMQVADARVPSYIPPPVAASILFTGKAVRILQHGGGVQQPRGLLADEDVLSFATQLAALRQQPRFDQLAFETCIADIRAKVCVFSGEGVVCVGGSA